MNSLRSATIRLAHMDESLRPHLLPLLKEAAWGSTYQRGKSYEVVQPSVLTTRTHEVNERGHGMYGGNSVRVPAGAVVQYEGEEEGIGDDSWITSSLFSYEGKVGTLSPNRVVPTFSKDERDRLVWLRAALPSFLTGPDTTRLRAYRAFRLLLPAFAHVYGKDIATEATKVFQQLRKDAAEMDAAGPRPPGAAVWVDHPVRVGLNQIESLLKVPD